MDPEVRPSDWIDGFPVLGNAFSLDFLNTLPVVEGEAVELLPDAAAVLRWLRAVGALPPDGPTAFAQPGPEQAAGVRQLHDFRERWRDVVVELEAGREAGEPFIEELNRLLENHPYTDEVRHSASGLVRVRSFAPARVTDAFSPILDSVVAVLTAADRTRLRKCGSCALHFLDTSKKGTRRWCSMQMCGNRAKVAAYAQRKRAARTVVQLR